MIAYYHNIHNSFLSPLREEKERQFTVAYEEFSVDEETLFNATRNKNLKLTVTFGVAFCHKDDRFVKKTGRDLARQRMASQELSVEYLILTKDSISFQLKNENWSIYVVKVFGSKNTRIQRFRHFLKT